MKNKLLNIFTSTWFIALIIAFVIFLFTHENFKEYSVVKIQEEGKYYDEYRSFYDVDNDSIDDNVDFKYFETVDSRGIKITNDKGKILNTSLVIPYEFPSFYADPYGTSKGEDKIKNLLYVIERGTNILLGTNRMDTLLEQIPLDTIFSAGQLKGVPKAYDYGYFGTYDVNKDGDKELYLYIAEGYRILPRRLYCVDYKNNRVLAKSMLFGAFPVEYEMFMIDKMPYFVVGSQATSNMLEYPDFYLCDTASYFMVFDELLNFKFEPIKFGENSSRVYFFLKEIQGKHFFYVFANPYDESKKVTLKKISLDGQIIEEIEFENNLKAIFDGVFSIENSIFYLDKNFVYQKFDIISNTEEPVKLKFAEQPFWLIDNDIDNDGQKEHLFRDKASNKIYVTRNDFSKSAKFELPLDEIDQARFYFPNKGKDKHIIFVWTYSAYYTFEYVRDRFYLFKLFGFIAGLFVGAFAIVYFIQLIVKIRVKKQAKITSRIKELEFHNVRSQMNPHFTLNTLNFISTSILKNEKEKAYDVISGFSNIIRSTLLDANKILRNLDEELKFIEDYLKIQKARFGEKFDYEINKNSVETEKIKIPPFIVQIFVENSLKHGLKKIKSGGLISISIKDIDKKVEIIIEDNGVGRNMAKKDKSTNSTGKGLKLTKEYIDLINSLNKEKITLNFVDKTGKETGLKVVVFVPKKLDV